MGILYTNYLRRVIDGVVVASIQSCDEEYLVRFADEACMTAPVGTRFELWAERWVLSEDKEEKLIHAWEVK